MAAPYARRCVLFSVANVTALFPAFFPLPHDIPMKPVNRTVYLLIAILLATAACNSADGERFSNQTGDYMFVSTTSMLMAYGASHVDNDSASAFRCPSLSGMRNETGLTVFYAQANGITPHFAIDSVNGLRGDANGGFGISLVDLPVGMLDIYERCHASTSERLLTMCPDDYEIVDSCSHAPEGTKACARINIGTHKLVAYATVSDDDECISEAVDRSRYSYSATMLAYACDAFSPIEIPAAIRGTVPSNYCCDENVKPSLEFCLKPCGCKKLNVAIVPKTPEDYEDFENTDVLPEMEDVVRIAVISNVEHNKNTFERLLESIESYSADKKIDALVNIGNLTKSGSADEFSDIKKMVLDRLYYIDGRLHKYGLNPACSEVNEDGQICCNENSNNENEIISTDFEGRIFTSLCNPVISKIAFLSGVGEDDVDGSMEDFRKNFGPSNFQTTIGKVQLIMLDTAEASVSSVESQWLESVLETVPEARCKIDAPVSRDEWPLLYECHDILGKGYEQPVTCLDCIQQEAYCVPPDASRSNTDYGPENCVCIPRTSTVCPGNLTCEEADGREHDCICTRDEDCGVGGTCVSGYCEDPVRLVFSYTPLFDKSGARNNAFTSKTEASHLLSMFIDGGVDAIFSGRVRDYKSYVMGGIPMYVTGGGGADMASFASQPHHWLLVEIPNGYTHPDGKRISVNVMTY